MSNPKARELLKDPETAMLMKMMQQNPNNPSYVFVFKKETSSIYLFI